ncbi:MAG: biosynthetic-type acetolactate synthase large subunit [Bacteroidia bacterium]|nr:biosynthetic-type acetolactate synthase large subunit [Bacteroidia bacterium]
MEARKIKGTEALLLSLLGEGTDTIFGYPGGTIMPFYDNIYDYSDKINHILVRHEQGAVHAAEGYARSTGKVGVCVATSGPGATNFITGIADAMMDSTPIVCITAQVNVEKLGTDFFQEADMIGITIPITKWSYLITKAAEIPETVAKAFHIAQSGKPGPVVLSLTKNAQVELMEFGEYKREEYVKTVHKPLEDLNFEKVHKAAELLNNAQRPLIIAGHGVTISKAEEELKNLAEIGNIPVANTLMGISCISTEHPLYIGKVGMHGNIAPNAMTQQADVILAVGMRFSDRVTGEVEGYAPNAQIIHIDIDETEINKNVQVELPIVGNAKDVLAEIIPYIKYSERSEWFKYEEELAAQEYEMIIRPKLQSEKEEIFMGQVVDCVSNKANHSAIIVTDVGQNQMFSARYAKFRKNRSWVTSGGLGTMGFGLPAAIGAKMGNKDREVIAILGDGGFQMNIQELGTIMQSKIGVKIVLLNNTFLGMVRQWQELFFNKKYAFTQLDNPDFQEIAKAYRIPSARVTKHSDLEAAVEKMLKTDGAYFLEVAVLKEENVFPMIPAGCTLNDIIYDKPNK